MARPRQSRSADRTLPSQAAAPGGLPSRADLSQFIVASGETDVAAIARHFELKGADRRALRQLLKSMQEDGAVERRGRKGMAPTGHVPLVGVADVVERDADGDLYVRLTKAGAESRAVRLAPDRQEKSAGAPALGDRLLVRFETLDTGEVEARLIKRLGQSAAKILGVVRKSRREVRIEPVDRRSKESLIITGPEAGALADGDLVLAQANGPANNPSGRSHGGARFGPKPGRVLEHVGREDQPRAASLIAIHAHDLPMGFSPASEAEARAAVPPTLEGRTDLRDLPLITIDPVDARDHDDAVFAHADDDEANPGGWVVWVAIADVAAYVAAGSALDRDAWTKANSVYFPDRVEPMLPELLSAGLCSLREGEDRACLAVRMVFTARGQKTGHRFVRGLMRSAAKLAYEQAQAAVDEDGDPYGDDAAATLLDPVLRPLWAAYGVLRRGRQARSPLEIDSVERRIQLSPEGEVTAITRRTSLEAHKLIEEMMIQANVCAAETLEQRRIPLIYRVHDASSQEKLLGLADFLATLDIRWDRGQPASTKRFNHLLDEARGGPNAEIVNEMVLRTQMQAHYSPDNIGHFGLNLQRYAHFTSPIRRYADLVVHRALIRALKFGRDGLGDGEIARLQETSEHITVAERRAMAAERDATDRYVAAFLADHQGAEFEGRITGVTRFGLFVRLTDTGADGLVPVSSLGDEYFVHDDRAHALIGERSGQRWRLGTRVRVRLTEATPITGGLLFQMLSEAEAPKPDTLKSRLGVQRKRRGPPSKGDGRSGGVRLRAT